MRTLLLILVAIIGYGFGGLNGSIITSRFMFHKDVRSYGSHNAGLTNFLRSFGPAGIAMVLAIDVLKTLIAVLLGGALLNIVGEPEIGRIFAGFCVVLGHSLPVLYDFRGGKGVLCAGTLILVVDWRVGLICWAVFVVAVIATSYVSMGSMFACAVAPLLMSLFGRESLEIVLILLCALLVIIRHSGNVTRILAGTENKLNFGPPAKK